MTAATDLQPLFVTTTGQTGTTARTLNVADIPLPLLNRLLHAAALVTVSYGNCDVGAVNTDAEDDTAHQTLDDLTSVYDEIWNAHSRDAGAHYTIRQT